MTEIATALDQWLQQQPGKDKLIEVGQALAIATLALQNEVRQHAIQRDDEESDCNDWQRALKTMQRLQREACE